MVGSGSEDRSRLEELGLHVAQSRERMAELDRAVTAIGNKCRSKLKILLLSNFNHFGLSLTLSPSLSLSLYLSLLPLPSLPPVSSTSREGPQPEEEPDGAKYVDMDSFDALQGLLSQLQQEHERLMGTAAHLSHELEINKEHVKVIHHVILVFRLYQPLIYLT